MNQVKTSQVYHSISKRHDKYNTRKICHQEQQYIPTIELPSNLKAFIPLGTSNVLIWNLARAQILCHITNFIS